MTSVLYIRQADIPDGVSIRGGARRAGLGTCSPQTIRGFRRERCEQALGRTKREEARGLTPGEHPQASPQQAGGL